MPRVPSWLQILLLSGAVVLSGALDVPNRLVEVTWQHLYGPAEPPSSAGDRADA